MVEFVLAEVISENLSYGFGPRLAGARVSVPRPQDEKLEGRGRA